MDETLPTCANVGIVSLGLTMAQGFMAFYRPWKSYDEEIQTLTESLQGLQDITSYLGVSFSNKGSLNNIPEDLRQLVMATLLSCQDACRRLEDMLDECKATDCSPFLRKHDWLRSRGAVYPFKKDTLVTLRSIVSDLRGNLFLALQLLPSIDSRVAAIDNRTAMILRAVGGGIPSIGQLQSVLREVVFLRPFVIDFELSPIEAAILKRSEEDLRHCLSESLPRFSEADMARPHFEFLLPMCLDWVPGMLLFLESALPRSAGAVGNSFIGACRAREFASALLLLGYMDEISYQHLYDAFECGDIEVMKTTSSQLATRRSQLQELALQQLPPNVIQSLELPKHGLLDIKSFNVCKALEQHKIIVDQRLIVQDSGSVYTHVGKGGVAAANILYESGFTDMNQYDMDGCNTISSVYPVKELGQVLGLVHWMICKGADIHLPSRGSPSITVIARTLADCLPCPAFFTPEDWFTRVNHIIKSLHIDSARLLLTILLDDDGNSGLCGCTKLKHTSLIVALECLTQRDSGFTGAHVAYIQDVLNQRCSEKTSREVVSVTLRYFTFKALGLTHSCDRQNCSYDDIWRIRTEERPLLDELEALLVDFNERYDALGVGLPEFFLGYWQTCMSGVPAADTPGEEYIQAQEL
ncbi:hypothetical protein BJX99DRAFT_257586 [Aspergillus californicus]